MNPAAAASLRRAAAHVLVDDVAAPALDEAASHHLVRVLRIGDGDVVTVTDGAGRWRQCLAAGSTLEPVTEPTAEQRPSRPITIGFALPKHDRPEWIVQKLTELGVDRIVVLHAERSVVRWPPTRVDKHLAKLRRVAAEALQQSRGVWLPRIDGPVPAVDLLVDAVAAEPGERPLDAGDTTIAVGPEGGWSPDELAAAADTASIGPTVLRVETAALAVAVLARSHSA